MVQDLTALSRPVPGLSKRKCGAIRRLILIGEWDRERERGPGSGAEVGPARPAARPGGPSHQGDSPLLGKKKWAAMSEHGDPSRTGVGLVVDVVLDHVVDLLPVEVSEDRRVQPQTVHQSVDVFIELSLDSILHVVTRDRFQTRTICCWHVFVVLHCNHEFKTHGLTRAVDHFERVSLPSLLLRAGHVGPDRGNGVS